MAIIAGRRTRGGLALVLMGAALLGVQAQPQKPGGPGEKPATAPDNPVTAARVKEIQTKYQAERAAWDKAGLAKVFSPAWSENADRLAKQGEEALAANHLATALMRYNAARRQLPTLAPNLPPHVVRVFGDGRWRHAAPVTCVAFSPDGKYLASAGEDGLIKVIDPATSNTLACFVGEDQKEGVQAIAFSPDGKSLASAGKKDVKLWDPKTGKEIRSLTGAGDTLACLAFSPDGKSLAAGGTERKLLVWNTASGELKCELMGANALIKAVAFSPDGKRLVCVDEDGYLRPYDLTKPGEKPFALDTSKPFNKLHALAFDPDSKHVYIGGFDPNEVKWVDIADHKERRKYPGIKGGVRCLALSKDGKTLATSYDENGIRLWDTATGQPFRTLTGHAAEVRSLAFSPDGLHLASGSADQSVRLWSLGTGEQHRSLPGQHGIVWSSAFSPDGKRLVTGGIDRLVHVWDAATDKEVRVLTGHKSVVTDARFSPDGKYILSCGGDKVLRLWNADEGTEVRVFQGHTAPVTSAAFSPDGKQIVSGSADRTARIWDTTTGRVLHTLTGHRAVVSSVAWSRDGKHIATGSADHTARLWDADGKLERVLGNGSPDNKEQRHTGAVSAVAFSPDSRTLATCGSDHRIKLWNVELARAAPEDFAGSDAIISSVVFAPDGKTLASTGADEVVRLWDVATHSEIQGFRGHTNWISSVAFSPDGHYLTSAGVDGMVKIWELSGRDTSAVGGRDTELKALAVSPDGKLLAAAGGGSLGGSNQKESAGIKSDNLIHVWELATGREVQTLSGHQGQIGSLAFLPDSKTLVSAAADNMRVWDAATGQQKKIIDLAEDSDAAQVVVMVALADGKQVQMWYGKNQVVVIDVTTGKRTRSASIDTSKDGNADASSLSLSTDGSLAVFGKEAGTAWIWDKSTGKLAGAEINAHPSTAISDLILTPDKKTLITGDQKGMVKIWDLSRRDEPQHTLKAHAQAVYAFAVSPDGKRFATTSADNVLKLWDVKTAKELRRWDLHRPAMDSRPFVRTLVFTPDGKGLVTANGDTTAYLLDCTGAKGADGGAEAP